MLLLLPGTFLVFLFVLFLLNAASSIPVIIIGIEPDPHTRHCNESEHAAAINRIQSPVVPAAASGTFGTLCPLSLLFFESSCLSEIYYQVIIVTGLRLNLHLLAALRRINSWVPVLSMLLQGCFLKTAGHHNKHGIVFACTYSNPYAIHLFKLRSRT